MYFWIFKIFKTSYKQTIKFIFTLNIPKSSSQFCLYQTGEVTRQCLKIISLFKRAPQCKNWKTKWGKIFYRQTISSPQKPFEIMWYISLMTERMIYDNHNNQSPLTFLSYKDFPQSIKLRQFLSIAINQSSTRYNKIDNNGKKEFSFQELCVFCSEAIENMWQYRKSEHANILKDM